MRKTTLLFAILILLAVAGNASAAAECSNCNWPCTGPYGDDYECNYDGSGPYGQCTSLADCNGCMGWFAQECTWFAEMAQPEPQPLLGVQRVTAVVVRHDPKPVEPTFHIAVLSR